MNAPNAPQTDARADDVDAFILFNEREDSVGTIVEELSSLGTSTYFWRRDIRIGERWGEIESDRLRQARIVLLFLGPQGWGPNHLRLAEEAQKLRKVILTVVIDQPPEGALDRAGGLFRHYRYFDLRESSVQRLAEEVRERAAAVPSGAMLRGVIGEMLERYSIREATPLARDILAQAARTNPRGPGSAQISTTRLLIATFEIGGMALNTGDHFGAVALSRVLESNERFPAFKEFRSRYLAEGNPTDVEVRHAVATENVAGILTTAVSDMSAIFGSKYTLSADGLVAALLRQPHSGAAERLQDTSIAFADLRLAVFAEVARLDPARADQWREALQIPAPVDEPTTTAERPVAETPAEPPVAETPAEPPVAETPAQPPGTEPIESASPATPEISPIAYAWMGNDNPDRDKLDDRLGVKDEAKAFARVAAARQVVPPLAFGIFGDWGSGKSFFMRLMQEHVDKLADGTADEAKGDLFHRNIVQIRFNAWHYAETNLWASLVDHIFFELDRWVLKRSQPSTPNTLFDNLATARELTLESAEQLVQRRKEQKAAAERLAGAERELTAAREKVGATPRLFWEVVLKNFKSVVGGKEIENVATTLGLDRLAHDAESLKKTLDSLEAEGERAKIVTNGIRRRLLAAPSLILILAAIVLVPPGLVWLRDWIMEWLSSPGLKAFMKNINESVLGIAGVLASAAGLLGTVTSKVKGAVATLEGFRSKLNEAIDEQVKRPEKEVKGAQEKLAKLTAAVAEAQASLTTTSERLAEAAREYASGTGRGRLLRFVRERASDGQYAKHLGLIAAVRKDFNELSAMMSKVDDGVQAESNRQLEAYGKRVEALKTAAKEEGLLTEDDKKTLDQSAKPTEVPTEAAFERIILYIDDLDRCPPLKVIEVLQAVHLLLTFPLFVAVVAVDARWVSRSLENHYAELLRRDDEVAVMPGATARDYLEKIFQVPYWVRAMNDQSSRDLLMGLATPPLEVAASEPASKSEDASGKAASPAAAMPPAERAGGAADSAAAGASAAPVGTDAASNDQAAALGAPARGSWDAILQSVRAIAQGGRDLLFGRAAVAVRSTSDAVAAAKDGGTEARPQLAAASANEASSAAVIDQAEGAASTGSAQETAQEAAQGTPQGTATGSGAAQTDAGASRGRIVARALELTEGEQAFMKHLAPCVGGTPRRALRFLNVYRVIKASLGAPELHRLEKEGGYRALMTQLAIATAAPTLQKRWSKMLDAQPDDGLPRVGAKLNAKNSFAATPDGKSVRGAFAAFCAERQTPGEDDKGPAVSETQDVVDKALKTGIADLRHYGDVAKRYSFGT